MIRRKLGTRGGKFFVAIVCALGFAIPAWVAMPAAHAAVTACTPIHDGNYSWTIPYDCGPQVVPNSKVCVPVFGILETGGYEDANECAAIWVETFPGRVGFWGVGTFSCSGPYTQCAGMNVSVDLSFTEGSLGATTVAPGHYKCNPNPGPACPGAAGENVASPHTGNIGPGSCAKVQAWDPYDGWNGNPNVIAIKPDPTIATHVYPAVNSPNVDICLASPSDS